MRAKGIILLAFLLIMLLPAAQAATLTCTIRAATSCNAGEALLIRLNSSEPNTPNNSHAQLPNATGAPYNAGAYPYSVCCATDAFRTITNTCSATSTDVLKLYDATDSHVQAETQTGYGYDACLNVTSGNITCEYPNDTCTSGYSQVLSIASSEAAANNLTNAHAGAFALYKRKVCCQVGAQNPPVVDSASISPSPTATTRDDLTCENGAVSDPDGDDVTLHYNWYRNGTSITVLNLPMDYDSSSGVTHDISGYANQGTVTGATFQPTGGKVGGGFDFTGNYIGLGDLTSMNIKNAATISVWVKNRGNTSYGYIFSNDRDCCGAYGGMSLRIVGSTNRTQFTIWNGSSSQTVTSNNAVAQNDWTHITAVFNGTHAIIYTDGAYDNAYATTPGFFIGAPNYNSYLGTLGYLNPYPNGNYRLNGTLDEFIIFNRSLSASEVATLYRSYSKDMNGTELRRADLWNCSITPVDSTGLNGSTKYSGLTTISGSPPLNVTLTYPAHNNNTVFERYVNFSWTASDERDGDQVNYTLNYTIQPGTCSVQGTITNILTTNRTVGELCYDQYYNWSVNACDVDGCSGYATQRNFTIASVVSIRLVNNNTDFGTLNPGQSIDTQYGGVTPFLIENDGNVIVNITLNASNSPFTNAALGSTAFQFKARVNETGAFNASGTQTTYTPVTAALKHLVKQLNYSDANDAVYTDINFTVPVDEPPGDKTTNVTFRAEVNS